ncbi:MAG: PKD domain-containing protein [Bacteroidetes bacterium]|nr:PKD domain-containing protein [Bacteroidota bacterium]
MTILHANCTSLLIAIAISFATRTNAQTCNADFQYQITSQDSLTFTVQFTNFSVYTDSSPDPLFYIWDFGDGDSSTATNPVHSFQQGQSYNTCLFVYDSNNVFCDTACFAVPSCKASFLYTSSFFTFSFTDYSTNASSWSWDFGDGNTSALQNPFHTYSTNGYYNVCLTISDTGSCTYSYCLSVWAGCWYDSSGFYYYANGTTVQFNSTQDSTDSSIVYSWDFGDGNNSTQKNPLHTYSTFGTFNVCLSVQDTSSTCTDTFCLAVMVNCLDAQFGYSQNNAQKYSFTFTDYTNGLITSWLWNFGDGATDTTANPTHAYLIYGYYQVCLTVSNDSCNDQLCQYIWIEYGQSIVFLAMNNGDIIKADIENCTSTIIGNTGMGFLDIAICPDGKMYGKADSLYSIDTSNASITSIGPNNVDGNSLTCDKNGQLLAVDGNTDLYYISTVNAQSTFIGKTNYFSAGDLTFYNDTLYLAAIGDTLVRIILTPFTVIPVGGMLTVGGGVYGIVTVKNSDCTKGSIKMLAFQNKSVWEVSPYTAITTPLCMNVTSDVIYGAASLGETQSYSPPIPVNLGNDSILCENDSLIVDAGLQGVQYQWSTGDTVARIIVDTSGKYWVQVSNNNCSNSDTINITFTPSPSVNLGNDTTLCNSDSLILDAGNPGSTYFWSTSATTQTLTVKSADTYWVIVSIGSCSAAGLITVNFGNPAVKLGNDTSLCQGNNLQLDATTPGATYLWSTGDYSSFINITKQGIYAVTVTVGSCEISDSIQVNFIPLPSILAFHDTTIIRGQSVQLGISGGIFISYNWSPSSLLNNSTIANPIANPQQTTTYYVTVIDSNGCEANDSVIVYVIEAEINIYIPNAFAPGCKCEDDKFRIYGNYIKAMELHIFDRWGERVYEYKGSPLPSGGAGGGLGWDGTYLGEKMNAGVYIYYLKYSTVDNPDIIRVKEGNINLIR